MNKRIIAGLFAITLVISGGSLPAEFAAFDTAITASATEWLSSVHTFGDFEYVKDKYRTQVCITKYNGKNTSVEIPAEVDGLPVTFIGDYAFMNCSVLKYIVIPDSVTSIGYSCFDGCSALTSVKMPKDLSDIGGCAFSNCKGLTSIDLPNKVSNIGSGAFSYCENLDFVTIPKGVTTISGELFRNCTSLKSVELPDDITAIGYYAFCECICLSSIKIPDGTVSIEDHAFDHCAAFTEIEIPGTVRTIKDNAFSSCESLEHITIQNGVTTLGNYAFGGCEELTSITIPDSVRSIGGWAFDSCTKLEKVILSKNIKKVSEYTFQGCSSLAEIDIPVGVTAIEDGAFNMCPSLKKVTILSTVKTIGNGAFNNTTIIRGVKDSAAEKFAKDNKIPFEYINPVIKKAVPGDGCVKLEWESVSGAQRYAVCGFVNGNWEMLYKTYDTAFTVPDLTNGTEYTMSVIAMFDDVWNKEFSNAVTVKPEKQAPVQVYTYPVISNVNISAKTHQAKIEWEPVDGAEKYCIAAYIGGKWKVQGYIDPNTTSVTTPKLTPGNVYTFAICARKNGKWDTSKINSRAFKVYAL